MTQRTLRKILTAVLLVLIGLMVLQALGYGIDFALDPASGVREFGYEKSTVVDDLTVTLVGLIGVGMLGTAALLTLAAILVWRRRPAGASIAMIIGGVYLLAGIRAYCAEWWWDAYFYFATGALLIVVSAVVRWLQSRTSAEVCD